MIINQSFEFLSPKTVEAAFDLWKNSEKSVLLAGGTDYIPLLKYGLKDQDQMIGLDQIPYLNRIEFRENNLFIGSMNRLQNLVEDYQVVSLCKNLSEAARTVASPQIRNVGTIGGNICQDRRCIYFNQTQIWRQSIAPCFKTGGDVCHQNPRSQTCKAIYHSDLAPVLIALEAQVECFGPQGMVEIPVADFISTHINVNGGVQKGDHLVCGVVIPKLAEGSWTGFVKQSVRESVDFPVINVAICYQPSDMDNIQPTVSIVVGAVAPEPIELVDTQQLILEQLKENNLLKSTLSEFAIDEILRKSQLILDTGLALPARKKAFGIVGHLIEKLVDFLYSQSPNR